MGGSCSLQRWGCCRRSLSLSLSSPSSSSSRNEMGDEDDEGMKDASAAVAAVEIIVIRSSTSSLRCFCPSSSKVVGDKLDSECECESDSDDSGGITKWIKGCDRLCKPSFVLEWCGNTAAILKMILLA